MVGWVFKNRFCIKAVVFLRKIFFQAHPTHLLHAASWQEAPLTNMAFIIYSFFFKLLNLSYEKNDLALSESALRTFGAESAIDARSLALLRCMIAITVMMSNWIAPIGTGGLSAITQISLAAYCAYSFAGAIQSIDWQR